MTKMRCACGHIISDSTDNLPYKAYMLPDEDYYVFGEEVGSGSRIMYECEECGRVFIKATPGLFDNRYLSYVPESPRRGVLRSEGASPEE